MWKRIHNLEIEVKIERIISIITISAAIISLAAESADLGLQILIFLTALYELLVGVIAYSFSVKAEKELLHLQRKAEERRNFHRLLRKEGA